MSWCENDDDDGGCGGGGGHVMLVVVVEVVIGRVWWMGQGRIGMGRRMAGLDVEVDVVVWVDVVLVTDSLGLFRLLIVSLQNDHTNRFIRNKRKQRWRQIKVIGKGWKLSSCLVSKPFLHSSNLFGTNNQQGTLVRRRHYQKKNLTRDSTKRLSLVYRLVGYSVYVRGQKHAQPKSSKIFYKRNIKHPLVSINCDINTGSCRALEKSKTHSVS